MRSVKRSMCAAMLSLQGVVLFLFGIVSIGATDVGTPVALAMGVGLATACIVTAGMLGRPGGYAVGWGIQVVSVLLGFVVTPMFVLGVIFGALWFGAVRLGEMVDRERAERAVLEEEWRAQNPDEHPDQESDQEPGPTSPEGDPGGEHATGR